MPEIFSNNNSHGFLIEGDTTTDLLQGVWQAINQHGHTYRSQRGLVQSIKGVTMVINNPLEEAANYPYWDKSSDDWYQDNFVRKETTTTADLIALQDQYPYRYAERSRHFTAGFGDVMGVINLFLRVLGRNNVNFENPEALTDALKATYHVYHPERVLAVLYWQGRTLMNMCLQSPNIAELQFEASKRDTLQSVIEELKHDPSSRRAITPSFTLEHIDHSVVASGVPVYQQYQLYVDFSKSGEPEALTSMHLHRAMDAKGGTQLDISHDREWGLIASRALGLPLKRIIINCNDIWNALPVEGANKHLTTQTDVRSWLFKVVDAYDPHTEDIDRRLSSPLYQKKISAVWEKLTK